MEIVRARRDPFFSIITNTLFSLLLVSNGKAIFVAIDFLLNGGKNFPILLLQSFQDCNFIGHLGRVARFFLVQTYQSGKKYTE
jgi:hypothetical protein